MRLRTSSQLLVAGAFIGFIAFGSAGVSPRASSSDYDAHQSVTGGSLGASIVAADRAGKIFSANTGKNYLVVEVGIYPGKAAAVDVIAGDFILRNSDARIYPSTAVDVAWHGQRRRVLTGAPRRGGPNVEIATGVAYGTRGTTPAGQPTGGLEVWSGIAVSNSSQTAPAGNSNSHLTVLEDTLRTLGLPEGQTTAPVAGYLYFLLPGKKSKNDRFDLEYSQNGTRVNLQLPAAH